MTNARFDCGLCTANCRVFSLGSTVCLLSFARAFGSGRDLCQFVTAPVRSAMRDEYIHAVDVGLGIGSGSAFVYKHAHAHTHTNGLTENAGPENAGPQKQYGKMEDKLPKAIT